MVEPGSDELDRRPAIAREKALDVNDVTERFADAFVLELLQ